MARVRTLLTSLSLVYVVVLAAVITTRFVLPRNDEPQLPGCYWVRLWGMSISCIQFPGHEFIEHVLNIPRLMIELPVMGVLFAVPRDSLVGLLFLGWGVLYWAPIVYLGWRLIARLRTNHAGAASAI